MEAEVGVKHDRKFDSLLAKAEVISCVHAPMHGSSGEQLGCGTTVFECSDFLVLPAFSADHKWAEQHKSLSLKHCGTVRYETGTDMRALIPLLVTNNSGAGPVVPTMLLSTLVRCGLYAKMIAPC